MFDLYRLNDFKLGAALNFLLGFSAAPDPHSVRDCLPGLIEYINGCNTKPYFHIGSNADGLYMERDWLIEKSDSAPAARIHKIRRSDLDRAAHNHPWRNFSVLLDGLYYELMPSQDGVEDLSLLPSHLKTGLSNIEPLTVHIRRPGDVICRDFDVRHKIVVDPSHLPTSLFVTDVKRQEWGFFTESGFVHHEHYLFGENSTDIRSAG